MKAWKTKTWQHELTSFNENAQLFGVNIFDYNWSPTGRMVNVLDPMYRQKHCFEIFRVTIDAEEHEFAAGEFSNGVWGFYLIKY
jgi:hypothetical protein